MNFRQYHRGMHLEQRAHDTKVTAALREQALNGLTAEARYDAAMAKWHEQAAAGRCTSLTDIYPESDVRDTNRFLNLMRNKGFPGAVVLSAAVKPRPSEVEVTPQVPAEVAAAVVAAAVEAPALSGGAIAPLRRPGRLERWGLWTPKNGSNGHNGGNGHEVQVAPVEAQPNGHQTEDIEPEQPAWTKKVYVVGTLQTPPHYTSNEVVPPMLAVLLAEERTLGVVPSIIDGNRIVPDPHAKPMPVMPGFDGALPKPEHGQYGPMRFDILAGQTDVPADVAQIIVRQQIDGAPFIGDGTLVGVFQTFADQHLYDR